MWETEAHGLNQRKEKIEKRDLKLRSQSRVSVIRHNHCRHLRRNGPITQSSSQFLLHVWLVKQNSSKFTGWVFVTLTQRLSAATQSKSLLRLISFPVGSHFYSWLQPWQKDHTLICTNVKLLSLKSLFNNLNLLTDNIAVGEKRNETRRCVY